MRFSDRVTVNIKSGSGGNGIVSFLRARHRPKLGPDGGNGGNGGDVYIKANENLYNLNYFQKNKTYFAQNGENGGSVVKSGSRGNDLILELPIKTDVLDLDNNVLFEINKKDDFFKLLKGGSKGFGNFHYMSAIDRSPNKSTKGKAGQEMKIILDFKLKSDIVLVGLTNSGKSSILSFLTSAKTKIGNYNFTTNYPQIGILDFDDINYWGEKLKILENPGFLMDKKDNKLGVKYLKHIEETKCIAYVLDAFLLQKDINFNSLKYLKQQIFDFDKKFSNKKQIIIINKIDLVNNDFISYLKKITIKLGFYENSIFISTIENKDIRNIKSNFYKILKKIFEK